MTLKPWTALQDVSQLVSSLYRHSSDTASVQSDHLECIPAHSVEAHGKAHEQRSLRLTLAAGSSWFIFGVISVRANDGTTCASKCTQGRRRFTPLQSYFTESNSYMWGRYIGGLVVKGVELGRWSSNQQKTERGAQNGKG